MDRPFHPIPPSPSFRQKIGWGAWYPVAGVLGESTERLLKSRPIAHKLTVNVYGSILVESSSIEDEIRVQYFLQFYLRNSV